MKGKQIRLADSIHAQALALEPLLSVDAIAALLGCAPRTVERLRAAGTPPKPDLRVGSLPRWKAETVRTGSRVRRQATDIEVKGQGRVSVDGIDLQEG